MAVVVEIFDARAASLVGGVWYRHDEGYSIQGLAEQRSRRCIRPRRQALVVLVYCVKLVPYHTNGS